MEKPVYKRLDVGRAFNDLAEREKLYAYWMSKAAWLGTRITLRQVSPEANDIFDLLVELHGACHGDWKSLLDKTSGTADDEQELRNFLDYGAIFLNNMGNYYGHGDQKIVPQVSRQFILSVASISKNAASLAEACIEAMLDQNPGSLGFPSETTLNAYYPKQITADEVKLVSELMIQKNIGSENTRIVKNTTSSQTTFTILQASVETDTQPRSIGNLDLEGKPLVQLVRGDHSSELKRIVEALSEALKYTADDSQTEVISKLQEYYITDDVETYKESLHKDPYGTRAEYESIVAVYDKVGSRVLETLVAKSQSFIATLPWVTGTVGAEKNGPFESDLFSAPEFTAVHSLAYASKFVFLGINLPNFEDIRQTVGIKNVLIANRDTPLSDDELSKKSNGPFVDASERPTFLLHLHKSEQVKITIHELLGHGTGKLLKAQAEASTDEAGTKDNFDPSQPPISPLTGEVIKTWYHKGETYNGVFGDLATSMEECHAECVAGFLMFERDLLAIFGYSDTTGVSAEDLIFNLYLHFGVKGLEGLLSYNPDTGKWGRAHHCGFFAMMRVLLAEDNFMTLDVDKNDNRVIVRIDRSKLLSHGKEAIRKLLLKIHIYRCTADVEAAKGYYSGLTAVDEKWLSIRTLVDNHKPRREVFIQANTFLEDDKVRIQEYKKSADGVLQSWMDRAESLQI